MKVSDYVAHFLASKNVKHVFTISGSGNVHLLDSIARHPALVYICPHHEQAGIMAANAYGRISSRPGVMLTTSGAGAANAVTGVLGAWADSVPVVVLSGQERTVFARLDNPSRMWGLQGWNVTRAVQGITKYAMTIRDPLSVRFHLEKAFHIAFSGRPGPVWLDFPTDVQAASVQPDQMVGYEPEDAPRPDLTQEVPQVISWLKAAKRPVILLGHGIRLAGGAELVPELMTRLPIPFLTSWAGTDLVPAQHPQHFGHEGAYGSRCANFVVQNCDLLITIGTRLSPPQIGYDFSGFARAAKKVLIDIDLAEISKFGSGPDVVPICTDARRFIQVLLSHVEKHPISSPELWMKRCQAWREKYPNPDPYFDKPVPGFINSYSFTTCLSRHLAPDEIIVIDAGTAFTCTHQCIALRDRQRFIGSRGLGEMGFGLPGAVGACFANGKKRVVLLTGDGSIMLNLQELQTVAFHHLPLKVFLYTNDGYLSIRITQRSLFGDRYAASGAETGVGCPDMQRVFGAFGFATFRLSKPEDVDSAIERTLVTEGPVLCEVAMHPDQPLGPRLTSFLQADGSLVSPPLEDLNPFLPREQLAREMIAGLHPRSLQIKP